MVWSCVVQLCVHACVHVCICVCMCVGVCVCTYLGPWQEVLCGGATRQWTFDYLDKPVADPGGGVFGLKRKMGVV